MTTQEALEKLEHGGEWPLLAEAIGVVASDPMTSLDALLLGLNYKGIVAEQAALGLYRRTFRPIPDNRRMLSTDREEWRQWLSKQSQDEELEKGFTVREFAEAVKSMDVSSLLEIRKAIRARLSQRKSATKGRRAPKRTKTSRNAGQQ